MSANTHQNWPKSTSANTNRERMNNDTGSATTALSRRPALFGAVRTGAEAPRGALCRGDSQLSLGSAPVYRLLRRQLGLETAGSLLYSTSSGSIVAHPLSGLPTNHAQLETVNGEPNPHEPETLLCLD